MKEELEQQLVEEYPELYRWYDEDPESIDGPAPPLATFGFTVGDGWYDLLDALSNRLVLLEVDVEVVQVKEKFGGLRFYHNGISADDERRIYQASGAIQMAEEMSFKICEDCGNSGEIRTTGWYRTLCDDCWSEEEQRRRPNTPSGGQDK